MANPFLVLGGVAVGVIAAGIGVLAVPGWIGSAQDANSIQDLSMISDAQSSQISSQGKYASSFADLQTAGDVRVRQSADTRVVTSANPAGTDWVGVSRSKTGSYFARISGSATLGKGASIEEAITAAGTTISGPVNARVTAQGVPVPKPFALADIVATNLFRNADATTVAGFDAYWGTGGNGTRAVVAAPWTESGSAVRFTRTKLGAQIGHFDLRPAAWVSPGKRYTMVFDIVGPGTYSISLSADGYPAPYTRVAASVPTPGRVGATPVRVWATFDMGATIDPNWQMYLGLPLAEGDWVELGNALIYEGDYDPSITWFSGGRPPQGALAAWLGDPGSSPSVLYR